MANKSKRGTKSIIAIEDLAKEDINFPEFCFGVIGKIPVKDQPDELEFKDKINPDAKITISRSKYGLPTQFTRDLRLALIRIAMKKNKFASNRTQLNGSEILEEMGVSKSGTNFKDLKKHLDILTGTRIKFINSYFSKDKGKEIATTVEFGILDGYKLVELKDFKNRKQKDTEELGGEIIWGNFFYENSIRNATNLIDLDYSIYRSLEGDITKQLYSFLNKRRYNKDSLRIELPVLAYEKLGISKANSFSKVRFKLKASHKSLMQFGIINKMPEFVKTPDKKEFVVYSFLPPQLMLDQEVLPLGDSKYEETRSELVELGFTDALIGKLFKDYPIESILNALKLYSIQSVKKNIKSPKNWVYSCLKDGFDMEEVNKLKEEEEMQKTEQELERIESENKDVELKFKQELSQKVDKWILQNTGKYFVKCKELYDDLVESNNTIFLDVIKKEVSKTGKSEVEVIMEKPAFVKMVRSKIVELVEHL
jgi:hypothetical protein